MDHNTLFAQTPPGKLFLIAALPGAIGMLASALYQLIDGILVGQVLGDTAFAAINLAMPFVIINFALADLIGVGSAVPISVRLGQREEGAANNIFTCACLMIVGTGALIGAALFFAAPLLFQLLGAEPELAALAVQYLRPSSFSCWGRSRSWPRWRCSTCGCTPCSPPLPPLSLPRTTICASAARSA